MTPSHLALLNTLLVAFLLPFTASYAPAADLEGPLVRQSTNGMLWEVTALQSASWVQGEAPSFYARLLCDADHEQREFTLLPGGCSIELRSSIGQLHRRPLFGMNETKREKLGARPISVAIDLRELFGELGVGRWTARVVLNENLYRVEGHTQSSELAASFQFQILPVHRPAVERANTPTVDVTLQLKQPTLAAPNLGPALLANRTNRPIEFWAEVRGSTKPLATDVAAERFVPTGTWVSSGGRDCGVGSIKYRLEPGKSVPLDLFVQNRPKFLRCTFGYVFVDQPRVAKTAVSNVIEPIWVKDPK